MKDDKTKELPSWLIWPSSGKVQLICSSLQTPQYVAQASRKVAFVNTGYVQPLQTV